MQSGTFNPRNTVKSVSFILASILVPCVPLVVFLGLLPPRIGHHLVAEFLLALGGGTCGSLAATFASNRWPWFVKQGN